MAELSKPKRWRRVMVGMTAAFLALNLVAYRHAWAMTHFCQGGERTRRPQLLGTLDIFPGAPHQSLLEANRPRWRQVIGQFLP